MASSFPPGFEIAQLSGPELITYLAEWSLFSTLTVQLYLYYQAFPHDRFWTKCLVYAVYTIHLIEIILVTLDAFRTFGYGFGDISALTAFGVSSIWSDTIPAMVSFIVQSFYAFRLYLISRSRIVPGLIVVASLVISACGFTTVAFVLDAGDVSLLSTRRISIFGGIWLGGSALIDILIAGCMTYYLTTNDTGFRQTKALVSKLVRLTIETGSLTALVALATLVLFFAFPGKSYYTTPANVMPFIYANTMLVVFNARFQIVGGRSTYLSSVIVTSGSGRTPAMPANTTQTGDDQIISITRQVLSDPGTDSFIEMKTVREASGDHV